MLPQITHLDKVISNILSWSNGPDIAPEIGAGRDTKLESDLGVDVHLKTDVVFHTGTETFAFESSAPNSLQQLGVDKHWFSGVLNALNEQPKQLECGFVQQFTVLTGDIVDHCPGELDQGGNEALKWTLGAIFGEWGLGIISIT